MKYLITVSDMTTEEKIFCDNESEATSLIEQKVRDGVEEENIQIFAIEPVSFEIERVPVVKISESAVAEVRVEQPVEDSVPVFGSSVNESSEEPGRAQSENPFLSEQIFSLDS